MLIGYHVVCPRKAWLSKYGLWMEQENEDVQVGRLIDKSTYSRAKKAIDLDAEIDGVSLTGRIDTINLREGVLHEVKKSRAVEEAHVWQLRFYLWLLRLSGVVRHDGQQFTGQLDYPKLRKTERVELDIEHVGQLRDIVMSLAESAASPTPPPRHPRRSFCRRCAFEDLCYG